MESLSAYARQFLSMMEKPDVDHIEGLSPAISIEQKSTSHNPRSTVGTVTEIYDYLRLLFARAGTPRCPEHGLDLSAQTVSQMVDQVLALPAGTRLMLLAPVVQDRKGEHTQLIADLRARGFVRARIDGEVCELDDPPKLDLRRKHTIEVVVDRFKVREDIGTRLAESFETALKLAGGVVRTVPMDEPDGRRRFTPTASPARSATTAWRNSSRACSPSTTRPAPAPAATASACGSSSIPTASCATGSSRSAGGAIRGWDRRNTYYFQLMQALAAHYDFDLETPCETLPERIQRILLQGSGGEEIQFKYLTGRGTTVTRRHAFEGILPNLERRYRETESTVVRDELAKYLSYQPCPDCGGSRLNAAARNVFVDGHSLPEIAGLSVSQRARVFREAGTRRLAR